MWPCSCPAASLDSPYPLDKTSFEELDEEAAIAAEEEAIAADEAYLDEFATTAPAGRTRLPNRPRQPPRGVLGCMRRWGLPLA